MGVFYWQINTRTCSSSRTNRKFIQNAGICTAQDIAKAKKVCGCIYSTVNPQWEVSI